MKFFKKLMVSIALLATGFLFASDDSKVNDILAKYGIDKSKNSKPIEKKPSTMAGDLAMQVKTEPKLSKQELQKTANVGKELENAVERVDDKKLDTVSESVEDSKLAGLKDDVESVSAQEPGALKRFWNYLTGLFKFSNAAKKFNERAAANLKRFKITFKNVSDALASVNDTDLLIPEKDTNGRYVLDKDTKAVNWVAITNDYSPEDIQALKQEALYIIIKEMVTGFKHLEPVIGSTLSALSLLVPDVASQTTVVYEVAVKFLPLLEKLAKESLDLSTTNTLKKTNNMSGMSDTMSNNTLKKTNDTSGMSDTFK